MFELGKEQLLTDDVPPRGRTVEAVRHPALLLAAEHRVPTRKRRLAAKRFAVTARVVGSVLTVVEHRELREPAVWHSAEYAETGAGIARDPGADRHVLVVGLVRCRATSGELRRRRTEFGREARVVIGDLVIVPDDEEREPGVRSLQIGIEPVQRMPQPRAA
jgi:hypothetical protein